MDNTETYDTLAANYDGQKESAEAWWAALNDGDVAGLVAEGYGDADSDPVELANDFEDGFALSVQVERQVRIWLTLGGPNISLLCDVDSCDTVTDVTYVGNWGGTRFERSVPRSSALWQLAERYVELEVLS